MTRGMAGERRYSGLDSSSREGRVSEIVFYQIPISHFCEKVGWALDFKGLDYRSVCVNPFTRKELEKVTKQRQVPVICDGTTVVCDSSEIVQYLDEKYPNPPLIPQKEPLRAECLALERIVDEELAPAVRRVAYSALCSDREQFARVMLPKKGATCILNPLRRRVLPYLVKRHFGMTAKRLVSDRHQLKDLLDDLEERLAGRRHFVGETLTIADIAVASILNPLAQVKELSEGTDHASVFSWMRAIRMEHGRRAWK